MPGEELARLAQGAAWRRWGPYLSERAWGTVREDYSPGGTAWDFFPHDHARSRTYRWGEDGLGGLCDDQQALCFAFAFWNERDPILKERIFGLGGPEGNHGEDAKEYWWFLDSTPTHSWMRWRYVYPQAEFPYARLVEENRRRGRAEPEFELVDTGVFDGDRYFDVVVDYARATPEDWCIRVRVRNAGPEAARIHVLPTVWFRNRWSWGRDVPRPVLRPDADRAAAGAAGDGRIVAEHRRLGDRVLSGDGEPTTLFCENESNTQRLWGVPTPTPFPKDGIGDHVLHGAPTVNPDRTGTKAALWYRLEIPAGGVAEIRLRFSDGATDLGAGWERTLADREREADEFHASVAGSAPPDEAATLRQALAGMLWSKQFFFYDVSKWLDGDPAGPAPPESRRHGRNSEWRHLLNFEVVSMPDTWEYPWYAAWDLAFHCIPLARVDPEFAKAQLVMLCREWFMHPNGQLPAYEWAFDDVNPPVHAWAALRVFHMSGGRDFAFLERIFHKLLINFTWWINRKDTEGNNVFEGGFLGLDNIGPFDRSHGVPEGVRLEQSDGTAWMAMYCLNMLEMALVLAEHDPVYEDSATKFFEHFTYIASAMNERGLWDEEDGFYYDVLHTADDRVIPLRARSMVGLVPLYATARIPHRTLERLTGFAERFRWFINHHPEFSEVVLTRGEEDGRVDLLLSVVSPDRLRRVLARMLDPGEFLSPYGIRSVSRYHAEHPLELDLGGHVARLDYEPAESVAGLYGGNSNWRGPIWFPVNYMLVGALHRFHHHLGDEFRVEHPVGSGQPRSLAQVADDLAERLIAIFRRGEDGRRPVHGSNERLQRDWGDAILFHEYFHGDTGAGLGASHQTGWTGLVADLIARKGRGRAIRLPAPGTTPDPDR